MAWMGESATGGLRGLERGCGGCWRAKENDPVSGVLVLSALCATLCKIRRRDHRPDHRPDLRGTAGVGRIRPLRM